MAAPNPAIKAAYASASEGLAPLIGKSYHINIDGHMFKIPAHPISGFCYMRNETITAYRAILSGKYTARQESFLFGVNGSVVSKVSGRIDKPIDPPPTSAPTIPLPGNLRNTPPTRGPQATQPARDQRVDQPSWHTSAKTPRRATRIRPVEPPAAKTAKERRLSEGGGSAAVGIGRERGTGVSTRSTSSVKAPATIPRQTTRSDQMRIDNSTNTSTARPLTPTGVLRDVGTKRKRDTDRSSSVSKAPTKKRVRFEEGSPDTNEWENRWSGPSQFQGEFIHGYWGGCWAAERVGYYIQHKVCSQNDPKSVSPTRTKVLTQQCQVCARRGEICKVLVDGIGIGVKTKQCGFCISNNQDCNLPYSGKFGG